MDFAYVKRLAVEAQTVHLLRFHPHGDASLGMAA